MVALLDSYLVICLHMVMCKLVQRPCALSLNRVGFRVFRPAFSTRVFAVVFYVWGLSCL